MVRNGLSRRTPWLSRITNEDEFAHREAQWLHDQITDYQYLEACYQLYQIQRVEERVRLSVQAQMPTESANDTTIARGSNQQ